MSDHELEQPDVNRLGRHILLEPAGQGNFATVWRAYDPKLDRRVAIKLVRARKADTADDLANQLAEAQALAKLAHPNVVAVHDVQMLEREDGLPDGLFIVMEFLDGPSLDGWMQEQHGWREIIEVFTAAGRGLAAAHERGIVHRDFKPTNAMFGGDGRLRVVDFGIARAAGARSEIGEMRGRYAGTPAYMSPEQHLGEAVDARSDQFAFCVALYEALYRRLPFAGEDRTALGKAKLRGLIEPPPRDTSVPTWVHDIVRRGMSPKRDDRFASMHELIAALEHDPRRATIRWVSGIALTLAIAATGYGLATFTADEVDAPVACESGEAKLEGIWDDEVRAEVAASFRATEASFATDAFERVTVVLDAHTSQWARVHRELCEATLLRNEQSVEVMAEQMLCLDRGLRRVAGLTGALRRADAATVARAPDSVLRLESPETCRDRHASERPQLDDAQRTALLGLEAEVARAEVLDELGRYEEALVTADAAIERATQLDDRAGSSQARLARSKTLWNLGRYAESIDGAEAALSNAVAAGDREVETRALLQLTRGYTSMGEYDAAEAIAEIASAVIQDGRLGHDLEANHDFVVAILYVRQRRFDEAIAKLEHAIALSEQMYGRDHPELAKFHNTLGNTLLSDGRDLDGALAHYDEALRLWIDNFGEQYPNVSLVRNNVGALRMRRGEFDEARRLLEQVLVGFEAVLGSEHPQLQATYMNLGQIASFQGRSREGVAHLERAREITAASFGEGSTVTADVELQLAGLLSSMGRLDEAEALYERTLRIFTSELPDGHANIGRSLAGLAHCRLARGDIDGWRASAEQAVVIFSALPTEDAFFYRGAELQAEFALRDGHPEQALELAMQALGRMRQDHGAERETAALYVAEIMNLLIANGKSAEAVVRGRETLASDAVRAEDRRTFVLHLALARALAREGDRKAAIGSYERALALTEGPEGNPREFEAITEELARFTRRQ